MSRRRICWTSGAGGGAAGSEGSQTVAGEAGSGLSFLLTWSAPFVLGTVHDGLRTRGGKGRLSRPRGARPGGLAFAAARPSGIRQASEAVPRTGGADPGRRDSRCNGYDGQDFRIREPGFPVGLLGATVHLSS